jgi:cephalosporin-C deacetylase-like acetyl esterase
MTTKTLIHRTVTTYFTLAAVVVSLMASCVTLGQSAAGWLVGQFGLSQATAFAIVALISSGGIDAAALVYPFLLPFIGTIQGLIFVFGTAVLVGW